MITECLLQAGSGAKLDVRARFLQLVEGDASGVAPDWQHGVDRVTNFTGLSLSDLAQKTTELDFRFNAGQTVKTALSLSGRLIISLCALEDGLFKLRLELVNTTMIDDLGWERSRALLQSFTSAHLLLGMEGGEFVSLLDPPPQFRSAAGSCQNVGAFPVLAGDPDQRSMMLCSPIILYDHPQVAPESAGDFFDSTEMDEMLALRVLTLTDDEKREMLQDERSRKILERTESLPAEHLMKVHGAIRGLRRIREDNP